MRLKNLELQGYKSFASRTEFDFNSGITAIVGPNGSGKSNIADAIRWVLGEQSYRSLRGKRTEDMIFVGSAARSRMGMASATLLLDNADGWLPIDFAEVSVARRAYRSGENEYMLNGSRVRLRDITELLAQSGLARRTYNVVGQGLVDAVLSLRAEDRRELFEEAAGITLYQSKRADAVTRLEETRSNLLRVNDIVNEIAPRLRRLEREAERAEHHALLTRQLEDLLRTWYGYRWRQEQRQLNRTRDSLSRREESLKHRRQALTTIQEEMSSLRARQGQLREELGDWHRESSDLHRRMEAVQRDLAVWQERARQQAGRADELEAELAELEARAAAEEERAAARRQEAGAAEDVFRAREAAVADAQSALDAHEAEQAALSRSLAGARDEVTSLAADIAGRRNRLAEVCAQRAAQVEARAGHEVALKEQQAEADALQALVAEASQAEADLLSEVEALEAKLAASRTSLEKAETRGQALAVALDDARRDAQTLEDRYQMLTRLRAEGEGLHAGVRAVLRAARGSERLAGVVGTVVQHVRVPPQYEVAVEVALGGHLQDVIVEAWRHAETAIAYLREGQRGRVTFLPLDTVRPAQRLSVPDESTVASGLGVVGIAADLVTAEAGLMPVVEMLLGRTIVVENLKAARRVFDHLRGGFQIVTLSGEVLRSSGTVTGGEGAGRAGGQVLAREREWRGLPGRIKQARANWQGLEDKVEAARIEAEALQRKVADLDTERGDRQEAVTEAALLVREREREFELLRQRLGWRREQIVQLEAEAERLAGREAELDAVLAELAARREAAEEKVADLEHRLEGLRGDDLYRRVSEARTAAAVARGTWEHRLAGARELESRHRQLRDELASRRQRLKKLVAEQDALTGQIREQSSRESQIQASLALLAARIEPAESELRRIEEARDELEAEETRLRERLRQAENSHGQALLAHSRQEDRLERLRRQIMDDFGLVEMEPTEGLAEQRPLPLGEMVSALPVVDLVPEGLEDEIHQIKAQLRRMGSVNPSAPDEYNEVLDRYNFLTTQATDLEEAALSLREVIVELDEVMRREFMATFEAVAGLFTENFVRLFGGGSAHLALTDPDDISQTGVEIVARPPGKRLQGLALLSGGERSLTAVALIFAILEVSPPPFCVLDEVDAMLDEANIRRFRQALEVLTERTQFILITHNRGTIEAADTIYGVTMGDDSVSQVVSLQLEGDRIAAPDGSKVEVKAG